MVTVAVVGSLEPVVIIASVVILASVSVVGGCYGGSRFRRSSSGGCGGCSLSGSAAICCVSQLR